jgi:hypothetical protein
VIYRFTDSDTLSVRKSLMSDRSSLTFETVTTGASSCRSLSPTSFIFTDLSGGSNLLSRKPLPIASGFHLKSLGGGKSSELQPYAVLHEYLNRKSIK